MLLAEPISLPTPTVPIDGLYHPASAWELQAGAGAVLLHGTAGNFYRGPVGFLAPRLAAIGIDTLAMNRRGHDVVATIGRQAEGGAFAMTDEGLEDAELMLDEVSRRGFDPPILLGHSNGGLIAAAVAARCPVRALVLLSAHAGGRDGVARDSRAGLIAGDRLEEITEQARALVDAGSPDALLLLPEWWHVTSARSFLDRLEATPDLLELAPAITCPTLVVRGSLESEERYPIEAFAARAGGETQQATIDGAEHHYAGQEEQVTAVVTTFLRDIGAARATT